MKSALKPLYKDQYDLGVMAKSAVIITFFFVVGCSEKNF